jgi:hypothetical protein
VNRPPGALIFIERRKQLLFKIESCQISGKVKAIDAVALIREDTKPGGNPEYHSLGFTGDVFVRK